MSFDINISKIKCSGKHGIYDHEKQNDQEFLVDININICLEQQNIFSTTTKCPIFFVHNVEPYLFLIDASGNSDDIVYQ